MSWAGGMHGLLFRWALGLSVALILGAVVTNIFVTRLRARIGANESGLTGVSPSLTGLIERLFFTVIVAFDISGTATAMMGWLGVKMASNWNRTALPDPGAFSALLGGLVSLFFALVGGLVCRAPK